MADIFHDNFESYKDGYLSGNNGWSAPLEFLVQSTDVHSGARAIKLLAGVGHEQIGVQHSFTAATKLYLITYVKVPTTSNNFALVGLMSGANVFCYIHLNFDGKIYISHDPDPIVLQTFNFDSWYKLEIEIDLVNYVDLFRVRINGGTWTDWLDALMPISYANQIYLEATALDADVFFDDVYITTTEYSPEDYVPFNNWGLMAKSQIDSETIEEAIDRLIFVHETDPDSHLGTGESLQSHKAEAIIDHVAQSIVADKLSSSNNFFELPVNSLDDHNPDNYTSLYPGFMAAFTQGGVLTGDALDTLESFLLEDWGYIGGDIVVDVLLQASGFSGTWVVTFDTNFARIQLKAGYHRFGYYSAGWVYSDWIAGENAMPYKFRVHFDSVAGILYFYRDGIVIFSVSYTLDLIDGELTCAASVNRGSATSATLYFGNIKVAFDSTTS